MVLNDFISNEKDKEVDFRIISLCHHVQMFLVICKDDD